LNLQRRSEVTESKELQPHKRDVDKIDEQRVQLMLLSVVCITVIG